MKNFWRQGKFLLRRRKDQKWEMKGKVWQPVLREEHVLREIVTRLWLEYRIKVWRIRERIPGMGAPSEPGIPDLWGWALKPQIFAVGGDLARLSQPVALMIEVKRPRGHRRPAQVVFIKEAEAAGCIAFFAESWEDCKRGLERHGVKVLREAA